MVLLPDAAGPSIAIVRGIIQCPVWFECPDSTHGRRFGQVQAPAGGIEPGLV